MKPNIPNDRPLTAEECAAATPSERFRLMNGYGALLSYEDKQAYGVASNEQQAQRLFEASKAFFSQGTGKGSNGATGPVTMQMPGQYMAPQMGPPMSPPQPQAAPQRAPMQMPPMPGPPQAPQAAPQQAPMQMPPMPGRPQVTLHPDVRQQALPGLSVPKMPGMPGMPGAPGMARPAPVQAAADERDPEPAPKGLQKAAAAVAPGGAANVSGAILKRLADNNEEIIATLSKVAEGDLASIETMRAIHAAVLGNTQMLVILTAILVDLYEAMAQPATRENFIPRWAANIQGGGVSTLLQALGQPGKG